MSIVHNERPDGIERQWLPSSRHGFRVLGLVALSALIACDVEAQEDQSGDEDDREGELDIAVIPAESASATRSILASTVNPCGDVTHLATIWSDEGHEYTFCADDAGGAGYSVATPIGEHAEYEGCALDVFLAVAPPDLEVPQQLVDTCVDADGNPTPADLVLLNAGSQDDAAASGGQLTDDADPSVANYCGGGGEAAFAGAECPNAIGGLDQFEWCRSALRSGSTQYTASNNMPGGQWPSTGKANVAACGGSAHLDYWKRETGDDSWLSLFNQDVATNWSVSTSWYAGTVNLTDWDHDDYRAKASSVGAGQYRFGGAYCDAVITFNTCW